MKNNLSVLPLIVLLALPAGAKTPVTIPFDDDYAPLSFQTGTDAPDGFDIAVARELAAILDFEPTFEAADFDRIQAGNWDDDWGFTVSSMSRSVEREARLAFVGPYLFDYIVIVAGQSGGPVDLDDVNGATVGVCAGCIYAQFLLGTYKSVDPQETAMFSDVSLSTFATDTDILRDLASYPNATVDFGVTSVFKANQAINDVGLALQVVGKPLFREPLWVVLPIARADQAPLFEAALTTLHNSGRLSELSIQYLGGDFTK
jgi:polar amino acid transport system substrate-binding protein